MFTAWFTGGSVVVGWDQKERAGPKDDRQVTVGSEGIRVVIWEGLLLKKRIR
jgi:hypothetical protein